jgi:Domain of unknown function (DUF4381)
LISDPLDALRPLHEPVAISWWPPAPGWWMLLLFLLVLVILLIRWWRRTTLQRAALSELKLLTQKVNSSYHEVAAINQLLKRYALVCWPASEVAALTGESWLQFLDRHGGNGAFFQGPGRALLTSPYCGESQSSEELIGLARRWIKTNSPCRN